MSHESVRAPLVFYSGAVNTSPLPLDGYFSVTMTDDPDETVEVRAFSRNQGDHPVGPIYLIYRHLEGECSDLTGICTVERARVGASRIDSIAARDEVVSDIETEMLRAAPRDDAIETPEIFAAQERHLADSLVEAGLTATEVEAFFDGWRHAFFDVTPEGNIIDVPMGISLAAIYVVPTEMYDEILPLALDPRPRELVRVGLGFQYVEPGECNGCELDDVPECS